MPIVTSEFRAAASSCPILFSKHAVNGRFYTGAMFGFRPGEHLVSEDARGKTFVPLNVVCDGFFVFRGRIGVDRGNPRFSETDGEPLFDQAAQPTSRLRQVQRALGQLRAGKEPTRQFTRSLRDLRVIKPIDVLLSFDGADRLDLRGVYSVSLEALRDINDAASRRLFRSGHLQLARTMAASLKKIAMLAERRNQRPPVAG